MLTALYCDARRPHGVGGALAQVMSDELVSIPAVLKMKQLASDDGPLMKRHARQRAIAARNSQPCEIKSSVDNIIDADNEMV